MSTQLPKGSAQLGLLLRRSRDALMQRMEVELEQAGQDINFSQFLTLKTLSQGAEQSNALAKCVNVNPGGMTRVIDKLVKRGLVERHADPADRRVWVVALTTQGEAMWKEISHCSQNVLAAAFRNMGTQEQEFLESTLHRVIDNLQDYSEIK